MIKKDTGKKNKLNNSGQAAIIICFTFVTLFLLLALSVNIGIYINDKINLQISADAAAYAGAAEQARILQEVGYANYEFRQLYKRFVYDYRYRFSIDSDRDPVISPSICVNYPFCDCVAEKKWVTGGVGQNFKDVGNFTCGSRDMRQSEMAYASSGKYSHQFSWNVNEPYNCDEQTGFNEKQAQAIKDYYEGEFDKLGNEKLPRLMEAMNMREGNTAWAIADRTIRNNLTSGNGGRLAKNVKITFPTPPEVSSDGGLRGGSYLSLIQDPNLGRPFRIYYTKWTPASRLDCYPNGPTSNIPQCTLHTCLRQHAAGYKDVDLSPMWFLKNPNLATTFVVRLERAPSSFFFPSIFGKAPKMVAVSAAKPFGGRIGWPDPYTQETIVKELYTQGDEVATNQFYKDGGTPVNPSYMDFMDAFYKFDEPEFQSLSGEDMPIPLVARRSLLERLHFTFDAEGFIGQNNKFDRIRFDTTWPFDPMRGIRGRSGYSVKFVPLRELRKGGRYKGSPKGVPELDTIEH